MGFFLPEVFAVMQVHHEVGYQNSDLAATAPKEWNLSDSVVLKVPMGLCIELPSERNVKPPFAHVRTYHLNILTICS